MPYVTSRFFFTQYLTAPVAPGPSPTIAGVTRIGGVAIKTRVSLYAASDMSLVATTLTTAGGSFSFQYLDAGKEYYVIFRQLVGTVWIASNLCLENDIVRPTVPNGLWYLVTQGGTTDGTEPVWPEKVGDTFIDGSCIVKAGGYAMLPRARGPLFPTPG